MVVFNDFFGIFGFSCQIIYDIIPCFFLYKLKSGALDEVAFEKLSILSTICIYFNALIYFVLCVVTKNEIEVMDFCNLQGSYLGIIYLIIYYHHFSFKRNEINKFVFYIIIFSLILSSVTIVILEYLLNEKDYFISIINWVGVIFNIGEYLPIGLDFYHLIKDKKPELQNYILFGAIVGIINTTLWLIWAILKTFTTLEIGDDKEKKYHTFIANIIGFLLCLSQIFVFCIYKKDKMDNDDNIKINNNTNNNVSEDDMQNTDVENPADHSIDENNNGVTLTEETNYKEKLI